MKHLPRLALALLVLSSCKHKPEPQAAPEPTADAVDDARTDEQAPPDGAAPVDDSVIEVQEGTPGSHSAARTPELPDSPHPEDDGGHADETVPPHGLEILPDNHWRIPRYLADRWQEHPHRLGTAEEHEAGWELSRVREGSAGWWIGLRPHDVIIEVNGMELDTMPKLIAAYVKLRNKTEFDVKIRRDGRPVMHHYEIVES